MLQDAVKDALGTISRQAGEDHDDHLVVRVAAARGLRLQEQSLVAADELDNVGLADSDRGPTGVADVTANRAASSTATTAPCAE